METGKANKIETENFDITHPEQYHISVEIGLKQLSYCIIDKKTFKVEFFKRLIINEDLFSVINNDDIIKLNFASSSVLLLNFPSTIIPSDFFSEKKTKDILDFSAKTYNIIKSDLLSKINSYLVYTIPDSVNDILFTFFPNAIQKAQQSHLIEQYNMIDENLNNAYLYINESKLNITIFKNSKLILNNSFHIDTKEDVLYHTLFTFEQLKLDTENINVKLYGNINKGDENHQLLYEYIRNINFGLRPKKLIFSKEFNIIPEHQFFSLFSSSI